MFELSINNVPKHFKKLDVLNVLRTFRNTFFEMNGRKMFLDHSFAIWVIFLSLHKSQILSTDRKKIQLSVFRNKMLCIISINDIYEQTFRI